MITSSLSKVDMDIRTPLNRNIFLSGGNSLIKGLPERVTNEVKKVAQKHMKVMVNAAGNRKNSCWHGSSILTTLSSFRSMWVNRNVRIIFRFLKKFKIIIYFFI